MAIGATRDALSRIFLQRCFWLFAALLLAVPAVAFQHLGLWYDSDADLAWSWIFSAALYVVTTGYVVRYVFQPRIMTQDKLFGAAAAYLMVGALFVAILIARLAGVYPPRGSYVEDEAEQVDR